MIEPHPPNQPGQLPRLAGGSPFAVARTRHLNGQIPTYWGPKQDGPDPSTGQYTPPGDWPCSGSLLRVPRVCRIFHEEPVDVEVVVALGVTGQFTFGQHYLTYDVDITAPEGIYPSHIHTKGLDQYGAEAYGCKFTLTYSGHLQAGDGSFDASGTSTYWIYTDYLPPFGFDEYKDRTSDTYKAISTLWDILRNGFTPAKPTTALDGNPPITITPDGPKSVGVCYPRYTGAYYQLGVVKGNRQDVHTLGLAIPAGWAQPPQPTPPWGDTFDVYADAARGATNPYVDAWDKADKVEYDDFLNLVTPIEDDFFGTHSLTVLHFAAPHPVPDPADPRIARIKRCYPRMAGYAVLVLYDADAFAEYAAANIGAGVAFLDGLLAVAGALKGCGWTVQGVSRRDPASATRAIDAAIAANLRPDLGDAPPVVPSLYGA